MAVNGAAGLGRKKPQLDIPIDRLELDPRNPRLPEEVQGKSQGRSHFSFVRLFRPR